MVLVQDKTLTDMAIDLHHQNGFKHIYFFCRLEYCIKIRSQKVPNEWVRLFVKNIGYQYNLQSFPNKLFTGIATQTSLQQIIFIT